MRPRPLASLILIAVIACSEPGGIEPTVVPPGSLTGQADLLGTIVIHSADDAGGDAAPFLRLDDATELRLVGVIGDLEALDGAEILATGYHSNPEQFELVEFEVRRVGGTRVSDGVLRHGDAGCWLELRNGDSRRVVSPSDDLLELIDRRVWIAPIDEDTPPVAFAAIGRVVQ